MTRHNVSTRKPGEKVVDFLLVVTLLFSPHIAITVSAQEVVRGDITFTTSCKPGEVHPPGNTVRCVAEVKFHFASNVTLDDAQNLAIKNGWVLANSNEMNAAFGELKLNTGGVAGMINDGRLALPVQGTPFLGVTRSPNIGYKGINSGFFYVQRSAAAREQAGPPPSEWSEDVLTNPLYNLPRYEMLCSAPPTNPMLDGWRTGDPVTVEAGAMLLRQEGVEPDRNALARLENELSSNPVRRWQYAPFMLRVMWDALTAKDPIPIQSQFRRKFEQWAACDETKVARLTLADWNRHIGKFGISLATQQYCQQVPLQGGGTGQMCQSIGVYQVPPETKYKMNTLGVLFNTTDGRGTTDGFVPLENPLQIGTRGQEAMTMLYKPMSMYSVPDLEDTENLRPLGKDMSETALRAGLTVTGVGLVTAGAGAVVVGSSVGSAQRVLDVAGRLAIKRNQEVINLGIQNGLSKAQAIAKAGPAQIIPNTGSALAKETGKQILKQALGIGAQKTAEQSAQAATQVVAKVAPSIGTRVVSVLAVVGIVATMGEIFGRVIAAAAKTDQYDASLNEAARSVKRFNVAEYVGPNSTEFQRSTVFNQLVKMTIADPADRGALTLDIPTKACAPGLQNATKMKCVLEVKFHNQGGLTRDQAQQIALSNGWEIATAEEVSDAWVYLGLDAYAYGMMADGSFAVPVQSDHSNFKKGVNLGATGGNQGFLYSVGKPLAPPPAGYVRFQNVESPSKYLHNQKASGLEYGPALAGWYSAMWKTVPVHSGWVRIQNRWYPNIYLHNQNGKLEAGPISPNWASAMWKLIPDKDTNGAVRIQNSWYQNNYIHSQGGTLQLGPIQPGWKSALWYVQGR